MAAATVSEALGTFLVMADQSARMDDELLSLAFSLHANPGAYALLVGAGASFSSGIPVAWEVLLDLCRNAAAADGEDIGEVAPDKWWERTRNEEPTYSRVLERLAKTAALRQALLEGYFEVSDADREGGIKQPTAAHKGIARLVALGAIKVIITLNFDRLIEQALRAAGIEPTVITHPSEIDGMRPLHQLDCVVIHLHGDYKNPDSMLNTENELGKYAPATKKLLERILEDYGLLIAGWSAKHDKGLREAIQGWHTNIARYPLVWIDPFALGEDASALLEQKRGTLLQFTADDALGKLAEAVTSLRSRNAVHPLTVPVAVATAKREFSGRAVAVAVHDTLAKAFAELHQHPDFKYDNSRDAEAVGGYLKILERIEESTKLPAALTATLAYWGNASTDRWWLSELERFSYRTQGGGDTALLEVRRVSGLWLFYAAGVSAVLAGRWQLLADVFGIWVPSRSSSDGTRQSLAKFYEPGATYKAPQHASAFFEVLRPVLMEATSVSGEALDEAWQTFELLRYTTQVMERETFSDLFTDYWNATRTLEQPQRAYENATAGNSSGDLTQLQTTRQEVGRLTGQIVRQTYYEHVHVLTADAHSHDRGWVVPLATKLGDEVRVLGDTHRFITNGLWDESAPFVVALDAVSAGLGTLGRELAYGRLPPGGGVVPSTMWLDTQETMYERGPRTLPV
jgi:hypothetical protein